MRKYILLLAVISGALAANADTWKTIGLGYYSDPVWQIGDGSPLAGTIDVEESNEQPGLFRFEAISDEYVYVHCENPQKVYVEDYTFISSSNVAITVSQRCAENTWNGNNDFYGVLNDRKVIIPGNYFCCKTENASNWTICSSDRDFVFELPSDGDEEMPSGIYFGITAFNYMPKFFPIQLIEGSNKQEYRDFVESQDLDDYTYLYYSVDRAIDALITYNYPKDLSSVALITFTDGNDDGSLEQAPNTSWTDTDYQQYVGNRIQSTYIQNNRLEAFSIGLKGKDIGDYNYALFRSNLLALASDENHASEVNDMAEVERTLNTIIDRLETSWLNKKVQVRINMRGTGDRLRFTLDKSRTEMNNNPENSEMWIEGVFNRDDLSLNDVVYHGFTCTSGTKVLAEAIDVNGRTKYQFTFENIRDYDGNIPETGEINFWHKNSTTPAWQPHTEFGSEGDVKTETETSSAAIMLVMDCSSSLGESDFAKLKSVVNTLVDRLADKENGINDVSVNDENAPVEYYNLQGQRIVHPDHGLYIRRQGKQVTKILIK